MLDSIGHFHEPIPSIIKLSIEDNSPILVEYPKSLRTKPKFWEKAVASGCCGDSPIDTGSITNYHEKFAVIGDAWHSNFAQHNLA